MVAVLRENEMVEAAELDVETLEALNDSTRIRILELLAEEPSYPAEVARVLDLSKQQSHYHFEKLKESGLVEEVRKEKRSGGTATFYAPSEDAYLLDLGSGGEKVQLSNDGPTKEFLRPLVREAELDGKIVVGSPDQHGPDQVRARDGHLAGEVAIKLGNYSSSRAPAIVLDTEVTRDEVYEENLLMIGGVLTNTVTKKFNTEFPASFGGESFPYHRLITPESEYGNPEAGVIAKAENPLDPEKSIFMVAGIRNRGTRAAVLAFKNLEELLDRDPGDEFYAVVEGRDMNGDGKIDSYEKVESANE